jgi:hypothetical protein
MYCFLTSLNFYLLLILISNLFSVYILVVISLLKAQTYHQ